MIQEPMTVLTDYGIAIESILFAGCLLRHRQQRSVQLWVGALLTTAIAAALGGICHGLSAYLSHDTLITVWTVMLYSLGMTSALMLSGIIISVVSGKLRKWLLIGAGLKLLVIGTAIARHPDFSIAVVDYLAAMVMILALQLHRGCHLFRQSWIFLSDGEHCAAPPKNSGFCSDAVYQQASASAGWLVGAIATSGIAAVMLAYQWSLASLSPNVPYHLVQMLALYLFYRGARLLQDC